jgi:hypothetical protein
MSRSRPHAHDLRCGQMIQHKKKALSLTGLFLVFAFLELVGSMVFTAQPFHYKQAFEHHHHEL